METIVFFLCLTFSINNISDKDFEIKKIEAQKPLREIEYQIETQKTEQKSIELKIWKIGGKV